jgi:hypothetical protein
LKTKGKLFLSEYFEYGRPLAVLLQAAWFGLLFGYAEAGIHVLRKYVLHRVIFQSQHFVWTIPLALLGLFLIVGIFLMTASLRWPQLRVPGVLVPTFVFIGLMALYYTKPKINIWAAFLLAGGVSIQSGRFVAHRGRLFYRVVTTSLPWMAILLIVIILGMEILYP